MISLQVSDRVSFPLSRAAQQLADKEPVNRRISIQLYGWTMRNFDVAGAMQTPRWAPLSARTLKEKARLGYSPQPLLRTGNLRQAFASYYDANKGGIGARASYFSGGKKFDYATVHQFGSEHIPARPMLPPPAYVRQTAISIYGKFISDSMKGSKTQ